MHVPYPAATTLALLLLLITHAAASPSAGCGRAPTLTAPTPYTLTVNAKQRQYYVRLPADYDPSHAYKLIFTFHALGGQASQVVGGTGGYLPWYGLPALDGFPSRAIYVAPEGLNNGWGNAGGEDIAFVDAVLEALEADLCVDTAHRYATGFSYGAAMSYSVACSRGTSFRAVAALSGGPISGCEGGGDPVAYYGQHGISDQMLPIAMGRSMRDRFVANNGCAAAAGGQEEPPEPASGSGTHVRTEYKGCAYPVVWVAFDGDHTPQPVDAGATGTWAANETWAFFERFVQE
ncbi:alpha/beta-hydrolase [Xylariomycetidae sp. FL2044]|nr:alpha/beta-hydrolase [Xylariomycetidae sp. FL2044]